LLIYLRISGILKKKCCLKTSIDADKKKEGLKMAQIVKITMENGNQIRVELDPVQAPITVANFVKLVEDGFYNGLIFHRVIPGFMIQGGCPDGTGMGGPGWQIKGEFKQNGVNNEIQHTRGVISMARSMMPDSAGSQFFIMHQDSPHLDGQYAAFGHVIEGIETVDAIAAVKTGAGDRPVEEQKIAKIEIEV
jgi:peptidyl-prolyl cis-trans isomerase B (cyclophilin B)